MGKHGHLKVLLRNVCQCAKPASRCSAQHERFYRVAQKPKPSPPTRSPFAGSLSWRASDPDSHGLKQYCHAKSRSRTFILERPSYVKKNTSPPLQGIRHKPHPTSPQPASRTSPKHTTDLTPFCPSARTSHPSNLGKIIYHNFLPPLIKVIAQPPACTHKLILRGAIG